MRRDCAGSPTRTCRWGRASSSPCRPSAPFRGSWPLPALSDRSCAAGPGAIRTRRPGSRCLSGAQGCGRSSSSQRSSCRTTRCPRTRRWLCSPPAGGSRTPPPAAGPPSCISRSLLPSRRVSRSSPRATAALSWARSSPPRMSTRGRSWQARRLLRSRPGRPSSPWWPVPLSSSGWARWRSPSAPGAVLDGGPERWWQPPCWR